MKFEMRQLSPQSPMLKYAHLERITCEFHQSSAGTLNYAIAGGGAVMLLLEAKNVKGYDIINAEADNKRKHKDLELYAFKPVFGKLNQNPHDIITLRDSGKFNKVDYRKEPPSDFELMIEILRGFHYDFLIPKEEDTTIITTAKGNEFYTLKPEFVIASKLFSANGIRKGIDDEDAIALLRRFKLNEVYLAHLIEKSEFAQVTRFENANKLIEAVENGSFYDEISRKVEEQYGEAVPEVISLTYSEKISVLRYNLEDLALSETQKEFIHNNCESQTSQTNYGHFKDFYKLCLRYIVSNSKPDKRLQKHIEKFNDLAKRDQHLAMAVASALKQTLGLLHQVYGSGQIDEDYDAMANKVTGKVLSTFYMHALTSAIRGRLTRIKEHGLATNYQSLVRDF